MVLLWRKLRGYVSGLDLSFLLFLALLCNVKLLVKAAALLLLLWRQRSHLRALCRRPPLLPLIYAAWALVGLLSALIAGRFSERNYAWAFGGSELLWLFAGFLS